jgi:nitroreductase
MELIDAIRRRRMVRAFDGRRLEREHVDRILDAIQRAPSAGFSQGTEFLVFDGPEEVAKLLPNEDSTTTDGEEHGSLANAQLLIVPLACKDAYLDRYAEPDKGWTDRDEARWPVPYWHVDAGMATMLALLTAVDLGLGGHFFGIEPPQLRPFKEASAYLIDLSRSALLPSGGKRLASARADRQSPDGAGLRPT